jgi:hypothetical protein
MTCTREFAGESHPQRPLLFAGLLIAPPDWAPTVYK